LGLNSWINPPSSKPTCFFGFKIFLTWQFLLGKNGKNNANSRKNVNNKKLAKNLGSKI
jgi:hypothetical protein